MRLIHTKTLELHDFSNRKVPKYVILSHTWGDDEISYDDYNTGMHTDTLDFESRTGLRKIKACCNQAAKDGHQYAWVDTCCIDKRSSAELSESINSMHKWYAKSGTCYVYLADVDRTTEQQTLSDVAKSRWFTRGWTLQEFLAPDRLDFRDQNWRRIMVVKRTHRAGSNSISWFGKGSAEVTYRDILEMFTSTTKIGHGWITGEWAIKDACVAEKLSWNAQRRTTRKEDEAYCMMGLFNVNTPLLYGEGSKAFNRLQVAIAEESFDHSLLAWGHRLYAHWNNPKQRGALAISASRFAHGHLQPMVKVEAEDVSWYPETHYFVTNRGLHVTLPFLELPATAGAGILVPLLCTSRDDAISERPRLLYAIPMYRSREGSSIYARLGNFCKPVLVPRDLLKGCQVKPMYLSLLTEGHSTPTWAMRLPIVPASDVSDWETVSDQAKTFVAEIYPPHVQFTQSVTALKLALASSDMKSVAEGQKSFVAMHLTNSGSGTGGDSDVFLTLRYECKRTGASQLCVDPETLQLELISGQGYASLLSFVLQDGPSSLDAKQCSSHMNAHLFNRGFSTGEVRCSGTAVNFGEIELKFLYAPG